MQPQSNQHKNSCLFLFWTDAKNPFSSRSLKAPLDRPNCEMHSRYHIPLGLIHIHPRNPFRLSLSCKCTQLILLTCLYSWSTWLDSIRQHTHAHACTHTRTHTHAHLFNGPLSGTIWVRRYQTGKTNLNFTEARDSEPQWHQLECWTICKSAHHPRQITTPATNHSVFTGRMRFLPHNQTNSIKALKVYAQHSK